MKIIDLLNKIANGEEVPKKIKYDDEIFIYDNQVDKYWSIDHTNNLYDILSRYVGIALDDEVEIIEEDKPAIAREALENRIENALEFLETQYNTFPSGEMWREALKNILQGKEYDDVYVEDKKIEKLRKKTVNIKDDKELALHLHDITKKIDEIIDYINKGD